MPKYMLKPVDQKGNKGCLQACLASLFNLAKHDVPNLSNEKNWWNLFIKFIKKQEDIIYEGYCENFKKLSKYSGINGYIIVVVFTCKGKYRHALVCKNGIVVHDPDELKQLQGYKIQRDRFSYFFKINKTEATANA